MRLYGEKMKDSVKSKRYEVGGGHRTAPLYTYYLLPITFYETAISRHTMTALLNVNSQLLTFNF